MAHSRYAKALACRESQRARGLRLMTMTVYPLLNHPSTMCDIRLRKLTHFLYLLLKQAKR